MKICPLAISDINSLILTTYLEDGFQEWTTLVTSIAFKTCTKHSTGYFPELVWASPQSPGRAKAETDRIQKHLDNSFFPITRPQQLHRTWCLVDAPLLPSWIFFPNEYWSRSTAFSFYTGSHLTYSQSCLSHTLGERTSAVIKLRPGRLFPQSPYWCLITNKSTCPVVPSILKVCSACSKCNWTICLELYIKLKTIFFNYIHATFMFSRFEIYFYVFIAT